MTQNLIIPTNYDSVLDLKQTEKVIKVVKDAFQQNLSSELKLRRVTAPLFVLKGTGINDDLNGFESPVSFTVKNLGNVKAEVVQSLAKWKRMILADYDIKTGYGIYTDMNAIRPDETLGNLHSLYVDQWDWEKVITKEQRSIYFLKKIVNGIFNSLKRTEFVVFENCPKIEPILPDAIHFIHAEELLQKYPNLSSKERENRIAKEFGAVFIIGIGAKLKNGEPHDSRAPDYDDWITETEPGLRGLNGDIILWNPILECAFEISSMGIRVDKASLEKQLEESNQTSRKKLLFHNRLLQEKLPLSIGGGIGQSRLCMFFLKKVHIGEVQSSIWPNEMRKECHENNIVLL